MKTSRRELSIDMVIHRGIFKNNLITVSPCSTFVPETGVSFHCVIGNKLAAVRVTVNYMHTLHA